MPLLLRASRATLCSRRLQDEKKIKILLSDWQTTAARRSIWVERWKAFSSFHWSERRLNIATSIIITLIACYYYYPITTFFQLDHIWCHCKKRKMQLLWINQSSSAVHVPRLRTKNELIKVQCDFSKKSDADKDTLYFVLLCNSLHPVNVKRLHRLYFKLRDNEKSILYLSLTF